MVSAIVGTWDVQIATPVGRIAVVMTFVQTPHGITGRATGRGEDVTLGEVQAVNGAAGETVMWTQTITKPLRLNLDFEVLVDGDAMVGLSRAGRLPSSKVTGSRSAAS
jgi:hypothetical protein